MLGTMWSRNYTSEVETFVMWSRDCLYLFDRMLESILRKFQLAGVVLVVSKPHVFNLTRQLVSTPLEFPTLAATDLSVLIIHLHNMKKNPSVWPCFRIILNSYPLWYRMAALRHADSSQKVQITTTTTPAAVTICCYYRSLRNQTPALLFVRIDPTMWTSVRLFIALNFLIIRLEHVMRV